MSHLKRSGVVVFWFLLFLTVFCFYAIVNEVFSFCVNVGERFTVTNLADSHTFKSPIRGELINRSTCQLCVHL